MAFSAADVKKLREMTGVGMMDCKKALTESDGDMDKAVEWLREKGLAASQKKAGRIAAEGVAYAAVIDGIGVLVEVNAETDFVAKNEKFTDFVAGVANTVAKENPADLDALMNVKYNGTANTVAEQQQEMVLVIGENIKVRRFARFADGLNVPYNHGGKIGVILSVDTDVQNEEVTAMAKNLCMQVAAMKPEFVAESDISAEHIAHERDVIVSQSLNAPDTLPKPILNELIKKAIDGKVWSDEDIAAFEEHKNNMNFVWNFMSDDAKPQLAQLAMADKENIVANKMFNGAVDGRLNKQLKEICLMNQTYVKAEDGKQSVANYVAAVAKAQGAKLSIVSFTRFETGEGIEKKQENFADEIAKMVNG